MKKTMLIMLCLLGHSAMACDICGCGVGAYYIGILPEFSKKIIGLRYRYNSLHTHLGAGGISTYLTTKEIYRTAELWGGLTINNNFRLMASVPVNFNERSNSAKKGIGDASVQGFYQLLNNRRAIKEKLLVQSLWLGAGIKMPTGKYKTEAKNSANIFQLGSGSTDFTVNAMYDLRLQDAGINTSLSYKVNTVNKEAYRYGNKLSANAQVYYKVSIKNKVTVAPNTGIAYERASKDSDHDLAVDVSGGNVLLGTIGVESAFKRIAFGANWQRPLSQNLAAGFVKANNRAMAHIAFMF